MRTGFFWTGLAIPLLGAGLANAQEPKSFKLEIGSSSLEIDPGETVEMTLPDGSKAKVTLTANPFRSYTADAFSFAYPSEASVTKSDLGSGVTQHLMATALGTVVIVQTYETLNPSTLVEMLLGQLTQDSIEMGAAVDKEPFSREAGQTLTGLKAREKGTDTVDYEVLAHGAGRKGVVVITRIDEENKQADGALLEKFWQSLKVK